MGSASDRILQYGTEYSLYLEIDAEIKVINGAGEDVPEAGGTFLALLACAGSLAFLRWLLGKHYRWQPHGWGQAGRSVCRLALLGGVLACGSSRAEYKGANPPDCGCNVCAIPNKVSKASSLSLSEGNLVQDYAAVVVKNSACVALDFTLTYNSYDSDGSRSQVDTVMGIGWTHSYNVFLFFQSGHLFRYDGKGRITKFALGPGGSFKAAPGYYETVSENFDGSFTITEKHGESWHFESIPGTPFLVDGPVHRLTRMVDRNGNTTTLTYVGGNLSTIGNSWGHLIRLEHNAKNRLIGIKDALDRKTALGYSSNGRLLITVTDPLGKSTRYTYNTLNQITRKTERDGRAFTYAYQNRKPVAVLDGAGATMFSLANPVDWGIDRRKLASAKTLEYIPSTTVKTDGRGHAWRYDYDKSGYITRQVAPDGTSSGYEYDPATLLLTSETNANGAITRYQYDALGNRIQTVDALDNTNSYAYEPVFNLLTSMVDPKGRTTTYQYDDRGNRTNEVDALLQTSSWTYDARGLLLTETDKRGHTTQHFYDSAGNRIKTIDALNHETTFGYDAVGNLRSTTDAHLHTSRYEYDALNRMIQTIDAHNRTSSTFYDNQGNVIRTVDRNGYATRFQYDLRRRLTNTIDALKQNVTQSYDGNDNRVRSIDQLGRSTIYTYDTQDRLTHVANVLNHVTVNDYDAVGNLIAATDANGHKTHFGYDILNRRISQTNPLGHVTKWEYKSVGCSACSGPSPSSSLVVKQVDANEKITYYKYDELDRRTQTIRKEGDVQDIIDDSDAVTETIFDPNGNPLVVIEPNKNTITTVYDALNRRTATVNAAGDSSEMFYDEVGNVVVLRSPNGNLTTNVYDALHRVTEIVDRVGLVGRYVYDHEGNRLGSSDGLGHTTTMVYDALYRPIRVTDPMRAVARTFYDPVGNVVKVVDREGRATNFEYDDINRRVSASDPMNFVTRFEYDNVGNLTKITDANNHSTQYAYDDVNRLIIETYPDPPPNSKQYTYDRVGNVLTRTDQKGQTTEYRYTDLYFLRQRDYLLPDPDDNFTYDLSGRMLTAERDGWVVAHAYDGANRLLQSVQGGQTVGYAYDIPNGTRTLTYPSGRQIIEDTDLRGRLVSVSDVGAPDPISTYTYDLANRVETRAYLNGVVAEYTYNDNDWVTSLQHINTNTPALVAGFSHEYDREHHKHYEKAHHDPDASQSFQYDNAYRLIDFRIGPLVGRTVPNPSTHTTWNLDPLANWNSKTTDGATESRAHSEANEITQINSTPVLHDANGNLFNDTTLSYTWDIENRLTTGTRHSDARLVGQYFHDALDRRIVKLDDQHPISAPHASFYFHDGARLIEEQNSFGESPITYAYGNYIDEVLTMNRALEVLFYHQNSLWSIIGVTDSVAAAIERYSYDAYGFVTIADGAGIPAPLSIWGTPHSGITNQIFFTGRQLDEETGLYFYRARYYASKSGRFLERDNLQYANGMNLYAGYFVPNYVDPTGNQVIGLEFNAFIPLGKGNFLEPGSLLGWIVSGDDRSFGGGSSRLKQTAAIESTKLGTKGGHFEEKGQFGVNIILEIGLSERFRVDAFSSKVTTETARADDKGSIEVKNTAPCTTVVTMIGAARYPFEFWSPQINWEIKWTLTAISRSQVHITLTGDHNQFPNYEALIDKKNIYSYSTPHSAPDPLNLNSSISYQSGGFTYFDFNSLQYVHRPIFTKGFRPVHRLINASTPF
jgi:RHS repeat-associated protein